MIRRRQAGAPGPEEAAGAAVVGDLTGDRSVKRRAALQRAVQRVVLDAEQPRRDELIRLRDYLVVDQDLAVQIRSIRPLDGDCHARQLRVGKDRVDLELAPGSNVGWSLLTFMSSIL